MPWRDEPRSRHASALTHRGGEDRRSTVRPDWGRTVGFAAVALALLLPRIPAAVAAGVMPAAPDRCDAAARAYLVKLPAQRAAETRIIHALDAKHYRQAARGLRSAVRRYADSWAGYTLGHLYAAGLGVPRSARRAARWYRWSAERGDHFAQRQLANAYLNGIGVSRDPQRAARWFRVGVAPLALASSDYLLARTYASGTLAPVNERNAAYYQARSLRVLLALSRERSAAADYDLGYLYAHTGAPGSARAKALRYFCRALALGYGPAAERIRSLEEPHR